MLRALIYLTSFVFVLVLAGCAAAFYVLWTYGPTLPDYRQLADYEPPVMTRVHAGDGSLMAEFARERRLFVPIAAIPRHVVGALLSAEDKTFYEHPGVDVFGIASAAMRNIVDKVRGSARRPVGASTITQQVAKNFLLTNEVSIERKLKEAILSFRIEHAFSKDRILELYLNEIYLGRGSYGFAAAALNYFNKSLDELTLEEAAYLAALPKAPNNYHPIRRHDAAVARRNWVLNRMFEDGRIDAATLEAAQAKPLVVSEPDPARFVHAGHFTEEVRRELLDRYGEDKLYGGGMSVRTTLEPALQEIAARVLREGLIAYDRRHGWRGPLARLDPSGDWKTALQQLERPVEMSTWVPAMVIGLRKDAADIVLVDGNEAHIPMVQLRWARPALEDANVGARPSRPDQVLSVGDAVLVEALVKGDDGYAPGAFGLRQIPKIEGALVAMDPHTGRVLAMVGGFSFALSEYNRATQARRQPGSAFKPFVYAAALDRGFTPASLVLDAPFVIDMGPSQGKWKPSNYTRKFYGPSTLRLGIEKSRNLMTVRLANYIGMEAVVDYAKRFGIVDDMPAYLPMALGAGETTLLRLTTAYSMLVNGGKRISPSLIDRIQDRRGQTIYRHDERPCEGCQVARWAGQAVPSVPDLRERVVSPATAYQVVSMLEGVVQNGTGVRIRAVQKPLAGKTGTTNASRDAWFMGFSPDLAVGVFAGFDQPATLGRRETGSSVAVPIFRDFMAEALKDRNAIPFRIPRGIELVRIDRDSGLPVAGQARGAVLEAFKAGNVPAQSGPVLDGSGPADADTSGTARSGTGGLY